MNFELFLVVRRSRANKEKKEIFVIMGTDFAAECQGSFAELR
jgi:hypothetical protein